MAKKINLEGLSEKDIEQIRSAFKWVSLKLEGMTKTLYELHIENEKFIKNFYKKQEVLDKKLYELKERYSQKYRV